MKSLALYVDKWYIIGSVVADGVPRPISLPNNEERIWLYFHEDEAHDDITYSHSYERNCRDKELHYYSDVFSLITNSSATYRMFKRQQPMRGIFQAAHIFSDLRSSVEEDGEIDTYISFSKDINLVARMFFVDELKENKFVVKQHVARIGHLALEYSQKQKEHSDGYYLVLNACNENLHFSLYKKSQQLFLREPKEDLLAGHGTDVRKRALIEHVVDNINQREHLLQTSSEREAEYLRMTQFVDDWLLKMDHTSGARPTALSGITFAVDPYRSFAVQLRRTLIHERTARIVQDIVRSIVGYVKDVGIKHEELKGILLLGNTFHNTQFHTELLHHFNADLIRFREPDLAAIVSVYLFIDCEQFSAQTTYNQQKAEDELKRIQLAEEEARLQQEANEARQAQLEQERQKSEKEHKFAEAIDKGYDAERSADFDNMAEYFSIALSLKPDSDEAKKKYNEALHQKAMMAVRQENYKKKIQQAKEALDSKNWDLARQKAEDALTDMPHSAEARRIKDEAEQNSRNAKEFERYIDRVDLLIAQRLLSEALHELEKAELLNVDAKAIQERKRKIESIKQAIDEEERKRKKRELQERQDKERKELEEQISTAHWDENYQEVVRLCQRYLQIEHDDKIADRKRRAEEKLRSGKKPPSSPPPNAGSNQTDDSDFFGSPSPKPKAKPHSQPKKTKNNKEISNDDFNF